MSTLELEYPFAGRWLVQNSPANRVPSHGTALFGLSYAIDFVPVDDGGRTAPYTLTSFFAREPPEAFPGFGRPVLAPAAGVVVGVHSSEPDHASYRGLPSVGYALTQRRRLESGWLAVIGNHVLIEVTTHPGAGSSGGRPAVVALCHLQRGSITVRVGQRVGAGELVGRCGNSGNSTEPHLHLQAVDGRELLHASAVPITFPGGLPRNGDIVNAG
ncbi:M23 family metallopeptidase [Citricoccus sp. NPDC055426]|uniref:M23 family metallopeptidase n=1 Tax=Citricoccus sp. NPDC055426 TaxID=3155536 RepID=UPI003424386D